MLTVATWNLLHRVHAENWGDDTPARWPDEAARIAAISARLAEREERVIALQEVSGDQLDSLRAALPSRTVHSFRYPRVPRPRTGEPYPLRDRAEYLVLLTSGPSRRLAAEAFDDDPGKGALLVEAAGTLVVATHVSGDLRRSGQLARLAQLATALPGLPSVLLGDFNADRRTVLWELGPAFDIAALPQDGPSTRPAKPTDPGPSEWIDHVVLRGAAATAAQVVPSDGLSDHNLVRATVRPRPKLSRFS